MIKRISLRRVFTLLVLCMSVLLYAQIPAGYYDAAEGKSAAELKTALHNIIKHANTLAYGSGAGHTWEGFNKTDRRPDGTVWDMYSNNRVNFNGNSPASGMNIEHSFAKSWWGGAQLQSYKDLHHLNPSDSKVNSAKSNYPMAVVNGSKSQVHGIIKVGTTKCRPGGEIQAWEPADEYKGDFARVYMYMVTAYEDFSDRWTGTSALNQLDNNTYPVFEQWTVDLLLEWNRIDPVSEKEINRNNAVYEIQGNRNPYIDYPDMAEYVWGNKKNLPFSPSGDVDYPYIKTPYNGSTVDFGTIPFDTDSRQTVDISAINLTGNITLSLTNNTENSFSIPVSVLTPEQAESGYSLEILWHPVNVGEYSAELIIDGGGLSAPVKVKLTGTSNSDFMALEATDVTSSSFVANWSRCPGVTGYLLNVYTMEYNGEEPVTILHETFDESKLNGWSSTGGVMTTEETNAGAVRIGTSSDGEITSPEIDLSRESVVKVRAKYYGSDDDAVLTLKVDGEKKAEWDNLSAAYSDYTVTVSGTPNSKISLFAASKRRVYVDEVEIVSVGAKAEKVPVQDYPKEVGLVTSYKVKNITPFATQYYYTVSSVGGQAQTTNEIVVSSGTDGMESMDADRPVVGTSNGMIYIKNIRQGTNVTLYDMMGRIRFHKVNCVGDETITNEVQGVSILRLEQDKNVDTYKIIN